MSKILESAQQRAKAATIRTGNEKPDYSQLVAHMDESTLAALIRESNIDNQRMAVDTERNNIIRGLAQHRLIGLQLQDAEVE